MKQLTTLLALLFFINASAQQITWKRTYYGPDTLYNSCVSINQLADSGFIILQNRYGPSALSQLIRTNKYGDSTWVKSYEFSQKLITTYDSGFALSGYDTTSSFIEKLNNIGDTVWKKHYPFLGISFVTQTKDSGYVLCGNDFILKTDSLGNVIWTTPCIGNFVNSIVCFNDDILGVGGWNDNYATILLDKYGAVKWTKYYGPFNGSGSYHFIKNAVQLPDSNFATVNYSCQYAPIDGWDFMQIDKNNGDTLFTKSFPSSCPDNLNMAYSNDSNLLICSDENIIKMTPSGTILWVRSFYPKMLEHITGCNDNGIAVTGNAWSYDQPGTPGFTRSIGIKLDSLGQFNSAQGLAAEESNILSVFPNPVANYLTISNLNFINSIISVTVFNVLGKEEIHQDFILGGEDKIEIDVNSFTNGIYFLQIVNGSEVSRSKFVKE